MKPLISLCMITKNEESALERCLRSTKGIVDEMIVVDTGSTDSTEKIARDLGAKVYSFAWEDDFSAARNAALSWATGSWILQLDADEELHPEDALQLRKLVLEAEQQPNLLAFELPIVDTNAILSNFSLTRLFRNRTDIRYTHRIHEHPELVDQDRDLKTYTQLADVRVIHHGYSEETVVNRAKSERNLNLLEMGLKEAPDDIVYLYHLGQELASIGEFERAIPYLQKAFAHEKAVRMPIISRNLILSLIYSGRYDEAVIAAGATRKRHPDYNEPVFLEGVAAFLLRDLERASSCFRLSLRHGGDGSRPATPENNNLLPQFFLRFIESVSVAGSSPGKFNLDLSSETALGLAKAEGALIFLVSVLAGVFPQDLILEILTPVLANCESSTRDRIYGMLGSS